MIPINFSFLYQFNCQIYVIYDAYIKSPKVTLKSDLFTNSSFNSYQQLIIISLFCGFTAFKTC